MSEKPESAPPFDHGVPSLVVIPKPALDQPPFPDIQVSYCQTYSPGVNVTGAIRTF